MHFNGAWPANEIEVAKFFPQTTGGLTDPDVPSDIPSSVEKPPPPDGHLASGGLTTHGRDALDEVKNWPTTDVRPGELEVTWSFTTNHRTRRYKYFITKPNWDPRKPLSRSQFDLNPIAVFKPNGDTPYDQFPVPGNDPITHVVPLPDREGYHVLYAVWEVADTGMAFHQVIDLNFGG
jgi:chitin-binding protein